MTDFAEFTLPVLRAIAAGRTYLPIDRCGERLRVAKMRGLVEDDGRSVPALTAAGWNLYKQRGGRR